MCLRLLVRTQSVTVEGTNTVLHTKLEAVRDPPSNSCCNELHRFLKIEPKFCLSLALITAITHLFYFDSDEV